MTPEEMLAALEKAKADQAAAEALLATSQAELDQARATIANHETALKALTEERDALKAQADTIPTLKAEVEELQAQDRDLEKAVAKRVAALGIGSKSAAPDPSKKTGQQLTEEFLAITDPKARAEFIKAHASELEAIAFRRSTTK